MTIFHHLKTPWLKKKSLFTKYLEISKHETRMFLFIHLNFEWKHSNLRLRLYLHLIKIIDKYKMIAKMLWPFIQVNLPLMFCINEIPISSQLYKKRLYDFFYRDVTAFHQVPLTPLFSITQHHSPTHPLCVTYLLNSPTWNKIHSSKQVASIKYTLDFLQLLLLKFPSRFDSDRVKKTWSELWSVRVFFAFIEKRRPNKCCLWEKDLISYL